MEPSKEDGTKSDAMLEVDLSNLSLQEMNTFQLEASKSTQAKDKEEVEEEVEEEVVEEVEELQEELPQEDQEPLLSVE